MKRFIYSAVILFAIAALPQIACCQNPYGGTPGPLPGTIQAEDFDEGGQGVASPPDMTDDDTIDLEELAGLTLLWLQTYNVIDLDAILENWITSAIDPGTPRINHANFETQDYVITTHNVLDYDAVPDDGLDDTQAFQTAIDACNSDGGGIIFVPAGKYDFSGRLTLKSGVYLRGQWQSPEAGHCSANATLLSITYGHNDPNAEPFISLGQSCGLKDLALWYPNQSFTSPVPYPWTLQQKFGNSVGLENITIYNAWNAILTGPQGNQLLTIKNLYMTALNIGFFRDQVYDCEKLQKIRITPRYWYKSALPGSPATEAQYASLKNYLLQSSIGAVIAHYDWTWMYDWEIEGCHTGLKTQRSLVKTEDRGPNGGFVNLKLIDNYIGMQIGDINRCGWADVDVEIRSNVTDAIGIKVTSPLTSIAQFINVTFDGTFKYCVWSQASFGCVTMSGCTFKGWAGDGYAVYAESGVIELLQNTFDGPQTHVFLGNTVQSAALLGNSFTGSPDITNQAPGYAVVAIDHTPLNLKMCDLSTFEYPDAIYKPQKRQLFNVRSFGAKGDGQSDDFQAFHDALNAAQANGGGTVYVPTGQYVLSNNIVIPQNTELRGVFDNCHHTLNKHSLNAQKGSELFALPGKGNPNSAPFIAMQNSSSLRGVTIYYPEQKWSDYLANGAFTPFPWTIQSQGQNVHLKDVLLVNSYKGADFGTYDSTGHNIDYLCGSVLDTGLYIDNCFGKGYVKNSQWNPSFWAWSAYPDIPNSCDGLRNEIRHTLTSFVFGYSQQENMLHNFSFGSKTGIRFINNPSHGGMNGTLIAHGVDHSGISMIFDDIGTNAQLVNFQIVSMEVLDRRRYLDIGENVQGKAEFYNLLGWGHNPCAETGIEMKSGDFYFLQSSFASHALQGGYGIRQTGGTLSSVAMRFGEQISQSIAGGYTSGLYGYFGPDIKQAKLIGPIKKQNTPDSTAFENHAGTKLNIDHSIYHIGY